MEQALRDCCKGVKIGKILVVRNHRKKELTGCNGAGGLGSPAAAVAAAAAAGNGLGGGRGRVVVSALSSAASSSGSAGSLCLDERARTPSPGGRVKTRISVGSDADGWITSQVRFNAFVRSVAVDIIQLGGSLLLVGWDVVGLKHTLHLSSTVTTTRAPPNRCNPSA